MKTYRILFSVGKDRPGIVEDLSEFLYEFGANIEDSRMAVMGGCFSIMALFSCDDSRAEIIRGELDRLKTLGLEFSLHHAGDPVLSMSERTSRPLIIDVRAMDHPGIVA